jgi:hypothetical protein
MLHAFLNLAWLILVWGLSGGAISRIAIIQVTNLRQVGIAEAVRFALRSASSLIVAPLCPLLGLGFCAAITAAFGLLYRVPVVGTSIVGAFLVAPLVLGFVMILMVAGLLAGWPLFHAAVAAGAEDALDALSRTFGYLNQRLGSFTALVVFVWVLGLIGLVFVDYLTIGVLRLTEWGLGLGAPAAQVSAFFSGMGPPPGALAAATHAFWLGMVWLVAHGWIYSYVWTAAALIYLWLRHAVDGTPWSELEPARMHPSP